MKRIMLFAAMALALAGCTAGGALDAAAGVTSTIPASPAAVADRTALDEQAMLGVELAYKAARVAVETAVDAGMIRGATASRVAGLDNAAFSALGRVRAAYKAGNATSYATALAEARTAVSGLLALTGKTGA